MSKKVLVIDDEQINLDLIAGVLGSEYEFKFDNSGEQGISTAVSWQPDVILLDVNMPGMNGLDACKKIRQQAYSDTLSIIFISAVGKVEERLAGYESGGDDYIIKPFNYEELQKKVKLAFDNKKKLDKLKISSNDAMSMAMTAMSQASDVGNILRFYQNSFQVETIEVLTKVLSETITSFGVNSVIYFNINDEDIYYSNIGVVKPLEQSAIEDLRTRDRIYSFSKCTLFNYGIVSVLITNMPIDNEKKYGELKDNIATLVEGAEARVNALIIQLEREYKQQENIKLIKATKYSLQALDELQDESLKAHQVLMTELIDDVQQSFIRLGLTEQQENELLATINVVEDESSKLFKKNHDLRNKIDTLMKTLTG